MSTDMYRYTPEKFALSEGFRRKLIESEQVLGEYHVNTLTALHDFGTTQINLGRHSLAEHILQQALEKRTKVLGKENPCTLETMYQLGGALYLQRKFERAEDMHRRTMVAREKVLGVEHPSTLKSMTSLGDALLELGKNREAEKVLSRARITQEKKLGRPNEETLQTIACLVHALHNQGRFREAKDLLLQAVIEMERVLGPNHPATKAASEKLVVLVQKVKDMESGGRTARRQPTAPAGQVAEIRAQGRNAHDVPQSDRTNPLAAERRGAPAVQSNHITRLAPDRDSQPTNPSSCLEICECM